MSTATQLDLLDGMPPRPRVVPPPGLLDRHESSLERARRRYRGELTREHHATCPCCERAGHVAKRSLSRIMVQYLIEMYRAWRATGCTWVDVTDLAVYRGGAQRGDYAYLVHFGLAIPAPAESRELRKGLWRPTPLGVEFLRGHKVVPSHVWIYEGRVFERAGFGGAAFEVVNVHQALGREFSYRELMEGRDE